ncbi:MAG TPA: hypothetical protein VH061_02660 [Solirubrobacteraceae bacterium]|jgi:hypothetical protein|nr:hypothetical protein [Solirubrobacteraceae bacterium]
MVLLSNVRTLASDLADAFAEFSVPSEPPREQGFKDTTEGRALLTTLRLVGRTDDLVALRTLLALRKGMGVKTADSIAETAIEKDYRYESLFYASLSERSFGKR